MIITSPHHLVHQFSLISQQDQTFRILIQPSHRINSLRITDIINDIIFFTLLGGADNPHRLVKCNQDLLILQRNFFPTKRDFHPRHNPVTGHCPSPIDPYVSLFNLTIRSAPGADPGFAEIFVNADSRLFFFHIPLHFHPCTSVIWLDHCNLAMLYYYSIL